jgi:uroporphyrin-III C-methyltransferase
MSETSETATVATDEARAGTEDTKLTAAARLFREPWFILLLLLLLVAGAGYYWASVVYRAEQAALDAKFATQSAALGGLGKRFDERVEELAAVSAAQSTLETRLDEIVRTQHSLTDSVKALYARDAQASLDWILAEAEYLILAAIQRLALEHDASGALAALRAADTRIQSARHPDLLVLRERLTRDITTLEAVEQPEIEGLALYLAEAATRVDSLPTKPIAGFDTSFSNTRDEEVAPENWTGIARALWRDLVSLVEVKHGPLDDDVLLDPKLRYLLGQNLRLELASARLAVLRRDDENFRAAVQLIGDLLRQYYDGADGSVRALKARLDDIAGIVLDPPLPDLADSLDAVRALRAASSSDRAP